MKLITFRPQFLTAYFTAATKTRDKSWTPTVTAYIIAMPVTTAMSLDGRGSGAVERRELRPMMVAID
jgi:hypothetical protein